MASDDLIEIEGIVKEVHSRQLLVETEAGTDVRAHLGGKMRRFRIRARSVTELLPFRRTSLTRRKNSRSATNSYSQVVAVATHNPGPFTSGLSGNAEKLLSTNPASPSRC